nr:zinc finger, CCHC-type [Tanacetum cinerariifolium]
MDKVSEQHSCYFNVEDDPKTFDEAMKSQDVAIWKEAINDDIYSIIGNNNWMLADLPSGFKPLGCKWIFKRKLKYHKTADCYDINSQSDYSSDGCEDSILKWGTRRGGQSQVPSFIPLSNLCWKFSAIVGIRSYMEMGLESVVYVLTTLIPNDDDDDATAEQLRKRAKLNSIKDIGESAFMSKDGLIPAFDMDTKKFVRLPDLKLKTLGERGIECIFVGYVEHSKAFRMLAMKSQDVAFWKEAINDDMDSIMGNNT